MRQDLSISCWQDSAPPFGGGRDGVVEGDWDVGIIGAGLTGLSAALSLARSGAKVAALETGHITGAASGRNEGQCNAGTAHDFGALDNNYGIDSARRSDLEWPAIPGHFGKPWFPPLVGPWYHLQDRVH